jgi:hypothetical protein
MGGGSPPKRCDHSERAILQAVWARPEPVCSGFPAALSVLYFWNLLVGGLIRLFFWRTTKNCLLQLQIATLCPLTYSSGGRVMTIKDWIQGAGVVAAVMAAAFSYEANQTANELKRQAHDLDKALEILWMVGQEAYNVEDPKKAEPACRFITFIAENEPKIRPEPPHLAKDFFEHLRAAGKLSENCSIVFEATEVQQVAATDISPLRRVDARQQVGAWHAVIATYDLTKRGCGFAERDVVGFAKALSHEDYFDPAFEGLTVMTARTTISNKRVVTVDTGEDRSLAAALINVIRQAASDRGSPETPPGERLWSGRDALVAGNRGWEIDRDCMYSAPLKPDQR